MGRAKEIAQRLVEEIPQKLDKEMEERRTVRPAMSNHCSEIGHDCERYLVYRRTRSKDQEKPSLGLQYLFEEGKYHHKKTRQVLENMGYEVTSSETPFMDRVHQISGTIDGNISGDDRDWETL